MSHAGLIPFPSHRRATDGVTVQSSPGQDAELLPVDSSSLDGHSQRQGTVEARICSAIGTWMLASLASAAHQKRQRGGLPKAVTAQQPCPRFSTWCTDPPRRHPSADLVASRRKFRLAWKVNSEQPIDLHVEICV
ncbi:unnamed protein product [Urochloa humidicola]